MSDNTEEPKSRIHNETNGSVGQQLIIENNYGPVNPPSQFETPRPPLASDERRLDVVIVENRSSGLGLVSNYDQMLTRIVLYDFFITFISCALILYKRGETWQILFIWAILVALVTCFGMRLLRLHDRISDLLHIRLRFDVDKILIPMMKKLEVQDIPQKREVIAMHRDDLMQNCFYRFAGSQDPKIDVHLIKMALDSWATFWVLLEGSIIWLISLIISIISARSISWLFVLLILGFVLFIVCQWNECGKRAIVEVNAILEDPSRVKKIQETFNAL